jgi:hypothetical protein
VADFMYNQGKGRVAGWADQVNANTPTNAAIILMAINTATADATLQDLDSFAAIESDGSTAEVTNSGYARKTLDQAGGLTVTVDDTNNRVDVDCPDQTWTAVAASPGAWTDLVFGFDSDTTGGTDSAILPGTQHDFAVTPDGSDITAQIATGGFFRAS